MFLEIVQKLLSIFQAVTLLLLLGTLIGAIDEWRHVYSTWKDIFSLLLSFSIITILLQVALYGIHFWGGKETLSNVASVYVFSWGLRIIALASFLRVLWPAKHWWSTRESEILHPQLKLFFYALLALGLSFVPTLLNLRQI